MIQQLTDADGRYIPLDTCELYKDDGTVVEVAGFSYMPRSGVWVVASYKENDGVFPCNLHLYDPTDDDEIDEFFEALNRIVENEKFRRVLNERFAELRERCE